eukprot:scaffold5353_cov134-Isochrysis_galbana.AAC.8
MEQAPWHLHLPTRGGAPRSPLPTPTHAHAAWSRPMQPWECKSSPKPQRETAPLNKVSQRATRIGPVPSGAGEPEQSAQRTTDGKGRAPLPSGSARHQSTQHRQ